MIVQNDIGNRYSPTVIAAAITSQTGKNKLPTHIEVQSQAASQADGNGLAKNSIILLEQIRTIDKRRLKEKMGHLDVSVMRRVNDALSVSFGLDTQPISAPETTGVADGVNTPASGVPAFS